MSTPALTYPELKALSPCTDSLRRVAKLMGGATKWDGKKIDAKRARKAGATFNDIVWAASAVARSNPDVERRVRLWLADCAARVLTNYETQFPDDGRIRDCIIASRAYARDPGAESAASARWSAESAAGAAGAAGAWSAAGAAWSAAGAASARWSAESAAGARWSAESAASAAGARWSAEQDWQFDRLIEWLGDKEPSDYPLPAKQLKKQVA